MTKIVVIGGGFAGVTTAYYLAKEGLFVELHESSKVIGGRTKSFYNESTLDWYDNGQHLIIKGYSNTLKFFRDTGTLNNFHSLKNPYVDFCFNDSSIKRFYLKPTLLNLLNNIKFNNSSYFENINLFKFLFKVKDINEKNFRYKLCSDFLKEFNQSENLINNFWKIFIESTLNTSLEESDASIFITILKKMFFEDKNNSSLIFNNSDFYNDFFFNIEKLLKALNVCIRTNSVINKVEIQNGKIISIKNVNGDHINADIFVFAIPFWSLEKIFSENYQFVKLIKNLETNSILNVHIWFKDYRPIRKFIALWGSEFHWVFFNQRHITVVKSVAKDLVELKNEKLLDLVISELSRYDILLERSNILDYKILRERRATFKSNSGSIFSRPDNKTEIKNLFIAGDFTNTNLPSTIESAVTSGMKCAKLILESLSQLV